MNRITITGSAILILLVWTFSCFAQDIHQAIHQGELEKIKTMLTKNPDLLEARNSDNLTPLHLASSSGNKPIVQFLIDRGADLHAGDNEGSNALHHAAGNGHMDIIQLLIDKGADLNIKDKNGMTALHFTAIRNHLGCGEFLIKQRADVNAQENNGRTSLFFTARNGNINFCRLLIENGANAGANNRFGRSPLTYAIWQNHEDVATLLITHGASLNTRDTDGLAPIHLVCIEGRPNIAKLLADHGADTKLKDNTGHLPLHLAAIHGQSEIADLLISKGTDVNALDSGRDTPLHGAAWSGDVTTVKLLIQKGAKPNIKNDNGKMPMNYAVLAGHQEIVDVLRKEGGKLSTKDKQDLEKISSINSEITKPIKMTVLYDNYQATEGTRTEWGFSCLIEGTEKTILFDTGGDAEAFMHNVERLNADLKKVDQIVISHNHWDHIGGLPAVLEKNPKPPVYIPYSFPYDFVRTVEKAQGRVVPVKDPVEICENVYLTGQMGDQIKEQSLILNTSQGSVIVTGCSHQGIVNIVKKAREIFDKDILLVFGGFHLMQHSDGQVRDIIRSFRELGVQKCGATHCTGDRQIALFKEAFGDNYVPIGTGRIIKLTSGGIETEIVK